MHVGELHVEMLGDAALDLLDGDPPVVGAQIVEDLLRRLQGDRAADQRGMGDDAVQASSSRMLETILWARNSSTLEAPAPSSARP
jgi:hypothetical protein